MPRTIESELLLRRGRLTGGRLSGVVMQNPMNETL